MKNCVDAFKDALHNGVVCFSKNCFSFTEKLSKIGLLFFSYFLLYCIERSRGGRGWNFAYAYFFNFFFFKCLLAEIIEKK